MQFLIVLAAALACALAEPQVYSHLGYGGVVPVGYTGAVGYTGGVGYNGAVAYAAPVTQTGHPVTYPVGYNYVHVKDGVIPRSRRDVPASTAKLESVVPVTTYTHPTYSYVAPTHYKTYSPVAAYSPLTAYSNVGVYPGVYGHPTSTYVTY